MEREQRGDIGGRVRDKGLKKEDNVVPSFKRLPHYAASSQKHSTEQQGS